MLSRQEQLKVFFFKRSVIFHFCLFTPQFLHCLLLLFSWRWRKVSSRKVFGIILQISLSLTLVVSLVLKYMSSSI